MENIWLKILGIVIFSGIWGFFVFNNEIKVDRIPTIIFATIAYIAALHQMMINW